MAKGFKPKWSDARRQFAKELMACSKGATSIVRQSFINANSNFLDTVQANKENLPYYTANLHDSIVTVVSQDGRLVRAQYMPVEATRPQHTRNRKRIVGEREAYNAVRRLKAPKKGVYSTLIVAVPYAEGANESSYHPGYLEWLENLFTADMIAASKLVALYKIYPGMKPVSPTKTRF